MQRAEDRDERRVLRLVLGGRVAEEGEAGADEAVAERGTEAVDERAFGQAVDLAALAEECGGVLEDGAADRVSRDEQGPLRWVT